MPEKGVAPCAIWAAFMRTGTAIAACGMSGIVRLRMTSRKMKIRKMNTIIEVACSILLLAELLGFLFIVVVGGV